MGARGPCPSLATGLQCSVSVFNLLSKPVSLLSCRRRLPLTKSEQRLTVDNVADVKGFGQEPYGPQELRRRRMSDVSR